MFFVKLDRDPVTKLYTVGLAPKSVTTNTTDGPWPEIDRYGEAGYWKDACELAVEAAQHYMLPISVMCPSEVPFSEGVIHCKCGAPSPFIKDKTVDEQYPGHGDVTVEGTPWRFEEDCVGACPLCGDGWMLEVQPMSPIPYINVTLTLDPDSVEVAQSPQDPNEIDYSCEGSMAFPW